MTRFTLLALVGFALASASAYQPSPLSSRAPLRRLTARRNEPNSVSDGPPLSDADSAALARMAERSDEDATTVGSAECVEPRSTHTISSRGSFAAARAERRRTTINSSESSRGSAPPHAPVATAVRAASAPRRDASHRHHH